MNIFKNKLEKQMDQVEKLLKKSKNEDLEEMLKYHFNNQEFRNHGVLRRDYSNNAKNILNTFSSNRHEYLKGFLQTEDYKTELRKLSDIEQKKKEIIKLENEIEKTRNSFNDLYFATDEYKLEKEVSKLLELHDQELKRIYEEQQNY